VKKTQYPFFRILANGLRKKFKKFANYMIQYMDRTWINGKFPRELWNLYQHKGPNTNNYQEGYNMKLNSKKEISRHPNPYLLGDILKSELRAADLNALAAKLANSNKRGPSKKVLTKRKERQKLMDNLRDHAIDLMTYMKAIGGHTFSLETQNLNIDDIGDIDSEDEVDEVDQIEPTILANRHSVAGEDLRSLRQYLQMTPTSQQLPSQQFKMSIKEGYAKVLAEDRLLSSNMQLSPTQLETLNDGK
jgi:hypothetical protein